jgi:hypothetical protein
MTLVWLQFYTAHDVCLNIANTCRCTEKYDTLILLLRSHDRTRNKTIVIFKMEKKGWSKFETILHTHFKSDSYRTGDKKHLCYKNQLVNGSGKRTLFLVRKLMKGIHLTLCFASMPSMCNFGYYSPVVLFHWHYMFRPNSHLQVYRFFWLRNLLPTVKLLCFSFVNPEIQE